MPTLMAGKRPGMEGMEGMEGMLTIPSMQGCNHNQNFVEYDSDIVFRWAYLSGN